MSHDFSIKNPKETFVIEIISNIKNTDLKAPYK